MTTTDPTQNDDLRFYTNAEVAAMLNLTERQVSRARQSGKLVGHRFSGSAVRHTRAQIDAWIAASTTAAK